MIESGHTFDISYKAIADARWVVGMLIDKISMAVINKPRAIFTVTQSNLSQSSLAYTEMLRWKGELGRFLGVMSKPAIVFHRVKKLLAGAYGRRSVRILIYFRKDSSQRHEFLAQKVPFTWPGQVKDSLPDTLLSAQDKGSLYHLLLRGLAFPLAYSFAFTSWIIPFLGSPSRPFFPSSACFPWHSFLVRQQLL